MLRIPPGSLYLLLAGWLLAQPARAADVYLAGSLGNSAGDGSASTSTDFYDVSGDDVDASPVYGGAVGLGFTLEEALPQVVSFELPSWIVRIELEFLTGRDYELSTPAPGAGDHFLNEFDARTLMPNLSLAVPVREPVRWLFGRVPLLEPMSLVGNVGIGISSFDFTAADNTSSSEDSGLEFAWQAGLGLDYELTDTTSLLLGWRYVSLGEAGAGVKGVVGGGDYSLDVASHEIVAGVRVEFYSTPLADMHPRHWRAPRVPLADVRLPGWLGGSDDEEASDGDEL